MPSATTRSWQRDEIVNVTTTGTRTRRGDGVSLKPPTGMISARTGSARRCWRDGSASSATIARVIGSAKYRMPANIGNAALTSVSALLNEVVAFGSASDDARRRRQIVGMQRRELGEQLIGIESDFARDRA